ncbi:MAG: hypothetical protein K2M56_04965 [Muribaculaceae bacterium]|nr:hypothetical protein [Muribaculaceae bacterium]
MSQSKHISRINGFGQQIRRCKRRTLSRGGMIGSDSKSAYSICGMDCAELRSFRFTFGIGYEI